MFTHEDYIHGVYEAAKVMVAGYPEKLAAIENIKLVYGLGSHAGARGVTWYGRWNKGKESCPAVEICAFGQENWTQVAGTTIHELGHVIAGYGEGHGKAWKEACELLGLRNPKAAGMRYLVSAFEPKLRALVTSLPKPEDGSPLAVANALGVVPRQKPCGAAIGVRGGKSRGVGSGSRYIKCTCPDCGYSVRVTGMWLAKGNPICPLDMKGMEPNA